MQISRKNNIPFFIVLHPDKSELAKADYNDQGQEIIAWAKRNNIKIFKELDYSLSQDMYRDDIHTNAKGQKKQAELFVRILKENKLL